jgi:hypothetical protein
MDGLSKTTTDHNEIREWAEYRGGKPARVKGTGNDDDPGILRIEFPGYGEDENLETISWDEFFKKFDESGLAFLCGGESRFFKFVDRE